ncbi:LysM peptidoglycan-binding domain-containing protein [Candidatus Peregrinibacteria bacterium]|nr:LysM peptidoglycan-binding domain-containing protein [Candidatus Peregrinibacteria bacterium]
MQLQFILRVAIPILIISLSLILVLGYSTSNADEGDETIYYLLSDHLGSIDVVLDETGNVVERRDYLPYGSERLADVQPNTTQTDNKFTGKEFDDETELYYYGARYYDPLIGRFTAIDPWAGKLTNPQSLNKYSYVLNNPLRYIDPTGLVNESTAEVEEGDTLIKIANEYNSIFGTNITYQELAQINNISDPNKINVGDIVFMGTTGENGEIWTVADPRNFDSDFRTGLSELQQNILNIQRNYYQRNLPSTLDSRNPDEWSDPIVSVAHNIGTTGNVEIRGIGPRAGQQAVYNSNGDLVTNPANMGTFDFAPPSGISNTYSHFNTDVQPWLDNGNSPADPSTSEQRHDAFYEGLKNYAKERIKSLFE